MKSLSWSSLRIKSGIDLHDLRGGSRLPAIDISSHRLAQDVDRFQEACQQGRFWSLSSNERTPIIVALGLLTDDQGRIPYFDRGRYVQNICFQLYPVDDTSRDNLSIQVASLLLLDPDGLTAVPAFKILNHTNWGLDKYIFDEHMSDETRRFAMDLLVTRLLTDPPASPNHFSESVAFVYPAFGFMAHAAARGIYLAPVLELTDPIISGVPLIPPAPVYQQRHHIQAELLIAHTYHVLGLRGGTGLVPLIRKLEHESGMSFACSRTVEAFAQSGGDLRFIEDDLRSLVTENRNSHHLKRTVSLATSQHVFRALIHYYLRSYQEDALCSLPYYSDERKTAIEILFSYLNHRTYGTFAFKVALRLFKGFHASRTDESLECTLLGGQLRSESLAPVMLGALGSPEVIGPASHALIARVRPDLVARLARTDFSLAPLSKAEAHAILVKYAHPEPWTITIPDCGPLVPAWAPLTEERILHALFLVADELSAAGRDGIVSTAVSQGHISVVRMVRTQMGLPIITS